MVMGLKQLINTNIYISVTGNAGPTANKPELNGVIYYSIYFNSEILTSTIKMSNLQRESIQHIIVKTIIKKLIFILNNYYKQ
jgi:nicotinamide mononucleotide (NMN) deamidase PncC